MKRTLTLVAIALIALPGGAASASRASAGQQGNGKSQGAGVSADGRYVVFSSVASNLVPGDTNRKSDVFLRDMVAKTTRRISFGLAGKQANGASFFPSVSDNGRLVAFSSDATNLVTGDTNRRRDVFVVDTVLNRTTRVSVGGSRGVQANGVSGNARISGSGVVVAFTSTASNLVSGDTNAMMDVFVRNMSTKTTILASTDVAGNRTSNDIHFLDLSPNGKRASWNWWAEGAGDTVMSWARNGGTIVSLTRTSSYIDGVRSSNGGFAHSESDSTGREFSIFTDLDTTSCYGSGGDWDVDPFEQWLAWSCLNDNGQSGLMISGPGENDYFRIELPLGESVRNVRISNDHSSVTFERLTSPQVFVWAPATGEVDVASRSTG